jgi:hypothetical protein
MHRSANDARYPHARHRGSYAADTISGFIQGLLDGAEFRQTAYAVDRDLSEAPLASFSEKPPANHAYRSEPFTMARAT